MRNTYLNLTDEDRDYLIALTKKRTIQARIVDHAKILLYKSQGLSLDKIAEKLDVTKRTVQLCISKYNQDGINAALYDNERSGRPVEISNDAKAWMINIACQRPVELGYSQELWTSISISMRKKQVFHALKL